MSATHGRLEELAESWKSKGLLDSSGQFQPTFLEDVGAACAENVRSAALMRWAKRNRDTAREWLGSVIGEEVGEISPSREVPIGKVEHPYGGKTRSHTCRIDLEFIRDRVYSEVKWSAPPSIEQLEEYDKALGSRPGTKIILLTPIDVVDHDFHDWEVKPYGWPELPKTVIPVLWSSLTPYLRGTADAGGDDAHEDRALSATIERWTYLYEMIEEHVNRCDIMALTNTMNWVPSINAPKDYSELLRKLVLIKLADKIVSHSDNAVLVRTNPGKGAHGTDVSVDMFDQENCFYHIENPKDGYGVLVSIRLRTKLDGNALIELQIGSERRPYNSMTDESSERLITSKLVTLRERLVDILKKQFDGVRSLSEKDRWSCQYSVGVSSWDEIEANLKRMVKILGELKQGMETTHKEQ